jgi:hypothetical protein
MILFPFDTILIAFLVLLLAIFGYIIEFLIKHYNKRK